MKLLSLFITIFLITATHAAEQLQIAEPAKPVLASPPEYPLLARRAGHEGIVILKLAIRRDGTVQQVEIDKSSNSQILDDAALEAAKAWKFSPAKLKNGEPVESTTRIPLRFKLDI